MKILFTLFLPAAGLLLAQQPSSQTQRNPDDFLARRLTRQLTLSSAQQNVVQTALAERRVETQGLGQQMRSLQTQMNTAIQTDNEGQIDQLSQQIAALQQQQTAANAKSAAKIYASLTADQKAKIGNRLGMLTGRGFGPFRRGRGAPLPPATPQQ